MNFKHLLACAGCCAAFGLVACGDDSSSNTSGSMDDRVEHFTVISLDEQNQTIVTFEERKKDRNQEWNAVSITIKEAVNMIETGQLNIYGYLILNKTMIKKMAERRGVKNAKG